MSTKSVSIGAMVMGLTLAMGCAMFGGGAKTDYPMSGTEAAPAAAGRVTVKAESNGNQEVEVMVEHLAAPGRAFQGASTYVVWLVPASGGGPQNMGVISTGEDLKGRLRIQTAFKSFEILVSAERGPNVSTPSENRVLRATVQTRA